MSHFITPFFCLFLCLFSEGGGKVTLEGARTGLRHQILTSPQSLCSAAGIQFDYWTWPMHDGYYYDSLAAIVLYIYIFCISGSLAMNHCPCC